MWFILMALLGGQIYCAKKKTKLLKIALNSQKLNFGIKVYAAVCLRTMTHEKQNKIGNAIQ